MGRQARAVHSSRSVSTFASVALVPAPDDQPRRTPRSRLSADALSEAVLRGVVFGAPLLMPLSLRAPRTRLVLAVYSVAFTAYAAAWVAVVWAPTSAWSTSAVGFTALAWTSILLFTGIGLRSTLRFVPSYRPWMYLGAAALFTVVHTLTNRIVGRLTWAHLGLGGSAA
jgi:hypothetical protein